MEQDDSQLVYLAAGSNLGDRAEFIRIGLKRLEQMGAVRIIRVSSLYESEPVGWDGGPWFLNAAAAAATLLTPNRLLEAMQETERWAGRMRTERNAPRTLDLDLLLFGDNQIHEPDLIVPHPRLIERAFVLWPLSEVAPEVTVAPGLTALQAAQRLKNHETIRLWNHSGECDSLNKRRSETGIRS